MACFAFQLHRREAHDDYGAWEWVSIRRGIHYYTTKHRHLYDEIVLITQHVDQLEKQMCSLVSETAMLRNNKRRSHR